MPYVSSFIAFIIIIPFFAWGIYILRLQLTYREELETIAKWITVTGVVLFLIIELALLYYGLGNSGAFYYLSVFALLLSTAALYGHLFVSIASQMVVDIIHPPHHHDVEIPDFAGAEALEQVGDYEGAVSEYMVIARIFPKDPDPILKIADTYILMSDKENAVKYFEKGLAAVGEPDRAVRLTNRLSGIYNRELNQPENAKRILTDFLERFPNSEHVENIQSKLERISEDKPKNEEFKSVTGLLEPPPTDLLG